MLGCLRPRECRAKAEGESCGSQPAKIDISFSLSLSQAGSAGEKLERGDDILPSDLLRKEGKELGTAKRCDVPLSFHAGRRENMWPWISFDLGMQKKKELSVQFPCKIVELCQFHFGTKERTPLPYNHPDQFWPSTVDATRAAAKRRRRGEAVAKGC